MFTQRIRDQLTKPPANKTAVKKTTCSKVRFIKGVAGFPASVSLLREAWIFAGNMTRSKTAKHSEAAREVTGISIPIAPAISNQPVNVTIQSGRGKEGGTIWIRSGRLFPQCADAVNKNITATAPCKEGCQ